MAALGYEVELEFTPLEFETNDKSKGIKEEYEIRIYSVGV